MKKRLDQILVEFQFAPSKTKAEELIESGTVEILKDGRWQTAVKPGSKYELGKDEIRISNTDLLKYVSRAGLKLEYALQKIALRVTDMECLDLGTSTGGFVDCLLKCGAQHVTGVDVSETELHPTLQQHPQTTMLLGVNARDIGSHPLVTAKQFELITADLSFISLEKIVPVLNRLPHRAKRWLLLIKPQFEAGKEFLNKKGLVRSDFDMDKLLKRLSDLVSASGYIVRDIFPSQIAGRDGNQEYFLYAEIEK